MSSRKTGILDWATSIRQTLANDSARQIFDEQINTHGFRFLDDYLENILAGPKREPIIDLVKTPARKRTRAATKATAKMQPVAPMSPKERDGSKENIMPVNDLHKAFLDAKGQEEDSEDERRSPEKTANPNHAHRSVSPESPRRQFPSGTLRSPVSPKEEMVIYEVESSPMKVAAELEVFSDDEDQVHDVSYGSPISSDPGVLPAPARVDPVELSMIAEDDEFAERSRGSSLQAQTENQEDRSQPPAAASVQLPAPPTQEIIDVSMDVSQQEIIDVSEVIDDDNTGSFKSSISNPTPTYHSLPDPDTETQTQFQATSEVRPSDQDDHTAPLSKQSQHLKPRPASDGNAHTAPPANPIASSSSAEVIMVPIRDADQDSPVHKTFPRKTSISHFPSLPAPSPLRKSTRFPRESSTGSTLHSATSYTAPPTQSAAVAPGGKRSSWLLKMKGTKVGDVPLPKSVSNQGLPAPVAGKKRTSEEMMNDDLVSAPSGSRPRGDENERSSKVAKLSGGVRESDGKVRKAVGEHPLRDEPKAVSAHEVEGSKVRPTSPAVWAPENSAEEGSLYQHSEQTIAGVGPDWTNTTSTERTTAAAALAEARAAAAAKIAEKKKTSDEETEQAPEDQRPEDDLTAVHGPEPRVDRSPVTPVSTMSSGTGDRLSVSDLILTYEANNQIRPGRVSDKMSEARLASATSEAPLLRDTTQAPVQNPFSNDHERINSNSSHSTTPPNSPPPAIIQDGVVQKSEEQLMSLTNALKIEEPSASKDASFLGISPFSLPPPSKLGGPSATQFVTPSGQETQPAQPSRKAVVSVSPFEVKQDVSPTLPAAKDPDYETAFGSHLDSKGDWPKTPPMFKVDDDEGVFDRDSWHPESTTEMPLWASSDAVEGKDVPWNSDNNRSIQDGSSSIPRAKESPIPEERKGDLGELPEGWLTDTLMPDALMEDAIMDEMSDDHLSEPQRDEPVQPSAKVNESKAHEKTVVRTKSQQSIQSMASSSSSSNTVGFFGRAANMVTNALGGGKKPVKSIQLAAAAAKKHQEEAEKKQTRMKEMEARRQQAAQRKAEEEQARAFEEERKRKEEAEKRKREREDHTEKKLFKFTAKKTEEDANKKRKITPTESAAKPETRKPPSKDKNDAVPPLKVKPALATSQTTSSKSVSKPASILRQPTATVYTPAGPSNLAASTSGVKGGLRTKFAPTSSPAKSSPVKGKGKQPANVVHNQMAARMQAQMHTTQKPQQQQLQSPPVASEAIELPDINSEYSDSEDEGREKKFTRPEWAQSPDVTRALEMQSAINPDDIFGPVRPLHMEELFRTRQSRFRARTSSANWSGQDRLTVDEEVEYARRMGYDL